MSHPSPWAADQRLVPTHRGTPTADGRFAGRVMTGIWYVVGLAVARVGFVFLTIGLAWFLSHRNRGDRHKGLPYESGIDTVGDTWGRPP